MRRTPNRYTGGGKEKKTPGEHPPYSERLRFDTVCRSSFFRVAFFGLTNGDSSQPT